MSLKNWYPFYVGDYARDTSRLSVLEHGAYILLLNEYYSVGEPLPDDKKQLYRICRAFDEQEQQAISKVLQLFFKHDANAKVYRQKKADEEIEKKADISHKRSQAAKNKGKKSPANAQQMHSKCTANADTSTSTSTSTITNTDNIGDATPPKTPKAKKGTRIPDDWTCSTELGEWAMKEYGMSVNEVKEEIFSFTDYWKAKTGANAIKLDWDATFRNWIRNSNKWSKK
jgi:uncharacterized protein YdaU (DUF1376 family)